MGERTIPTLDQWWAQVAAALAVSDITPAPLIAEILDLTRDVAHGVSRPAAPLTAFLVGVALGRGATAEGAISSVGALLPDPG